MSSRFLNQLPMLALAVGALSAQQAHAATQSTSITNVVSGSLGTNNAYFEITPIQATAIADNTPVDLYFKGELDSALRCKNIDGCGPVSLTVSATFNFNVPGASGQLTTANLPFTFTSYGSTDFGDYLDLKAVKLASDPVTLSYFIAQGLGLIIDQYHPAHVSGSLSFGWASIQPDGPSAQTFYQDFDHISFALVNPTFNIHYFSAPSPVPEPSSYALMAVGLAAVSVVGRRLKSQR